MDRERRAGSIRGPLHGIPIIIKASVLGESTTALGYAADSAGPMAKTVYDLVVLRDINGAYGIIKGKAKRFAANVPLATPDSFELDGKNSQTVIIQTDLKTQLNSFLEDLNESKVGSLEDIIAFNKQHADQELPTRE
ncbi:hypothetical protein MAJ_08902, partial [Metarhizium majus ARSEF 297]